MLVFTVKLTRFLFVFSSRSDGFRSIIVISDRFYFGTSNVTELQTQSSLGLHYDVITYARTFLYGRFVVIWNYHLFE